MFPMKEISKAIYFETTEFRFHILSVLQFAIFLTIQSMLKYDVTEHFLYEEIRGIKEKYDSCREHFLNFSNLQTQKHLVLKLE